MQNSHRQIMRDYWSIILIILLTPVLLYAVLLILPTHDDWVGSTTPDFKPFFTKEHFFFYGYHWRPFDTWIGYIVGRNPQVLWPTFNHVLVVIGHLLCSLSIYQLLNVLKCTRTARNIATLYFFITPATMATVTAVDSQNQVYALLTGLITFFIYVRKVRYKYIVWSMMIFVATLFKENGLMWALICPILAHGFDFIDKKTLKKDLLVGIGIMICYALAIIIQPKDIIIHPEYEPGPMKVVNNFIKFFFSSFITVDYIYLLHQPSRNILLALISLLFTLHFFYIVFLNNWKKFLNKKMVTTVLCMLIAVGPHLLTIFSMMHTYAGLVFVAIMTAYFIDTYKSIIKPIILSFSLFLLAAIAINIHLIDASIKSGRIGKRMAQEAIQKTGNPVKDVYVIIIEDDYPKLSSFCVIPNEAFGWGLASRYETNYQWPQHIKDTTIMRSPDAMINAKRIGKKLLYNQQTDCVWIIDHDKVKVVKP